MPFSTPIPYTVPSTYPIRLAGSQDPPFRIINLGLESTVWLSRNSGMRAGEGTPLHPGTSVLWTEKSELFAIADSGTVDITLTNDVEDWQPDPAAIAAAVLNSGVLVIDNPVPLLQVNVNGPGSTLGVEIGRFQSVNISIELTTDNPVNPEDNQIEIIFGDGGTTTYILALDFAIEGQIWTGAIPCYGDVMQVTVLTDSTFAVFASGSHRSVQAARQRIDEVDSSGTTVNIGRVLLFQNTYLATVVPGLTTLVTLPPWLGEIEIVGRIGISGATPATGEPVIRIASYSTTTAGYNTVAEMVGVASVAAPASRGINFKERYSLNGESLRILILNTYAANLPVFSLRVSPSSGGSVS